MFICKLYLGTRRIFFRMERAGDTDWILHKYVLDGLRKPGLMYLISVSWRQGKGVEGCCLTRVECSARMTQNLVYIRISSLVISNSAEQRFWRANSCVAAEEIFRLLCHPNVYNSLHKSLHCFGVRHSYLPSDFTKRQITLRLTFEISCVGWQPSLRLVSTTTGLLLHVTGPWPYLPRASWRWLLKQWSDTSI